MYVVCQGPNGWYVGRVVDGNFHRQASGDYPTRQAAERALARMRARDEDDRLDDEAAEAKKKAATRAAYDELTQGRGTSYTAYVDGLEVAQFRAATWAELDAAARSLPRGRVKIVRDGWDRIVVWTA